GMGGHDAGDVASSLVRDAWRTLFDALLEQEGQRESKLVDGLVHATMNANRAISDYVDNLDRAAMMGSTLLGVLLLDRRLFWVSIGDSPLYLHRNGRLIRVNEDHSMAPIIDAQAADGTISVEQARQHPDRNQLTSVVAGGPIPRIDCPSLPLELAQGDIILVASDGLQSLEDIEIQSLLNTHQAAPAQDISMILLQALQAVGNRDQDNISIAVIKPLNIRKQAMSEVKQVQ
ncbi:SpoIIE family protein phosphatase, partial [Aliiroseovarius sp. KMU-50]